MSTLVIRLTVVAIQALTLSAAAGAGGGGSAIAMAKAVTCSLGWPMIPTLHSISPTYSCLIKRTKAAVARLALAAHGVQLTVTLCGGLYLKAPTTTSMNACRVQLMPLIGSY